MYQDAEIRRRTVLVAVMNNASDLARARDEGWYRVPQRRAPKRLAADYLAFYQTGAFKGEPEAQTVTFLAPTLRYRLLTRREMVPSEPTHPRADDFYYRIEIGPLQRLDKPVPARTMRRLTFIHTTMGHLLAADDVRDLFLKDDPFERLWRTLRESRLRPLPNRLVDGQPLDVTLRARGGYLGIRCTQEREVQEARAHLPERWTLLHLAPHQLECDLDGCLRQIGAALINLGGTV